MLRLGDRWWILDSCACFREVHVGRDERQVIFRAERLNRLERLWESLPPP